MDWWSDLTGKCVTVGVLVMFIFPIMYIFSFTIFYSTNLHILCQIYNSTWEGILDKTFMVFWSYPWTNNLQMVNGEYAYFENVIVLWIVIL